MAEFDVSIVPCQSYDMEECRRALCDVLAPIGGLDWVTPGMTVAVKANLVIFFKPESAATTHPALLRALIELLRERGADVLLGDSPGGLYTSAFVNRVYAATGMKQLEGPGVELNQDFGQSTAHYEGARVAREFVYTSYLDRADAIIDFCKLKSHGMMGMSAAAKNMFGVIPGTIKPEYHFRYPNAVDFARMIVDLDEYFKPRLSIADAVIGMEGNGPTQGTPRPIGAVAASFSPHKLDLVCAHLIGLGLDDVPTLQAARERDLIPEKWSDLSIFGDPEAFVVPDFKNIAVHNSLLFDTKSKLIGSFLRTNLEARPKLKASACKGCQKCFEICPAKAIAMKNGKPQIDRSICIRCFCCQEFCPFGAMRVHRPPLARLLNHK